jgi:TolB-like protein
MPSIVPSFEYDIFISYRHNDNLPSLDSGRQASDGWVTDFVQNLEKELKGTLKDTVTIYFDRNPHDGLLETYSVDKSLEGKLKCLIFIPIISQTYCDTKSFAWQHEFCAFNGLAKEDVFGRDIKLSNGNVASRMLPIKIYDLDADDKAALERETGGVLRPIEFIYKEPGVNRPLKLNDSKAENLNKTDYRNQVNKVANAIKEIVGAMRNPAVKTEPREGKQYSVSGNRSSSPKTWILGSILALIVVASGIYFYGQRTTGNEQPILDKSIAVLPFDDFMEEEGMKYFADGLTEEILNALAKTPDLKVASRTSSFQYKGKNDDARKIASELGVAHILEGSVRGSGDRLRITAQLIRASDGFHLWSENYDKTRDDIIQIQEDIALKIAQALQTAMDPEALKGMMQSGTRNIEAYAYYLKGMSMARDGYEDFEKARTLDSTFAKAHYMAANFWDIELRQNWGPKSNWKRSYSDKVNLYNQRIELAIQFASALDKLNYQADQSAVNLQFRKALHLYKSYVKERPNDEFVLAKLITVCAYLGEFEQAGQFAEALELGSLKNESGYSRALAFYFTARQYTPGSALARKALLEFPNGEHLLLQAHRMFYWSGMIKEGQEAYHAYMREGNNYLDPIINFDRHALTEMLN